MRTLTLTLLTAVTMAIEHEKPDSAVITGTRLGKNGEIVEIWEGNKDDDWDWANSQNVDYTKVNDEYKEATNIFGNKDQKKDFVPIVEADLDENVDYDYKFENILDLWKNDENVINHRNHLLEEGKQFYLSKVGDLPKVCNHEDGCAHFCGDRSNAEFPVEGIDDSNCMTLCHENSAKCASTCAVAGQDSDACRTCLGVGSHCRQTHKELLQERIKEKWETIANNIKTQLETIVQLTSQKFTKALEEAETCAHGCQCQFIGGEYKRLKQQEQGWLNQITELEAKILGAQTELDEINKDACDFTSLITPYEAEWERLRVEWEAKIAVYQAEGFWRTDNWNMNEAVDQEKFRDLYNFDYNEELYDLYTETRDNLIEE